MEARACFSDGHRWNSSSKRNPVPLMIAVEIRDKKGRLMYHYSDNQLPYFTHTWGLKEIKLEDIESLLYL